MLESKLTTSSIVEITVRDGSGTIKDHVVVNNMMVNSGLLLLGNRLVSNSESALSYMQLGTDNTDPEYKDIQLGNAISSKNTVRTEVYSGVKSVNIENVATFTGISTNASLKEAGLFNGKTSGVMVCRTVFDSISVTAEDVITVKWIINIAGE